MTDDDFAYWYKYFLSEEKRAWEDGWRAGYEAGRRNYFEAREQDWAEVLKMDPWFIDKMSSVTYDELEERRYGPIPEGFTEPEHEDHPGEARRRARARGKP